MNKGRDQYETLWEDLLSRQPDIIQAAFATLDHLDQHKVIHHLHRMVNEDGWQPEQRLSAQSALDALIIRPGQDR
jgi:hypothetical protein